MMSATPCPICGRPPAPPHRPFCSQGCRDRDLLQWLNEGYRLPVRDGDMEAEDGLDSGRIAD